jgi:DNA-binding NarL/FixJ family response regulator
MRILIADDHALVRSGLKLILAQIEPDAEIAEAVDGRDAVNAARRLDPELVLLDLTMPGLNGLDALPLLLTAAPRARVLVLSMHTERHYVTQALKQGAQGYLVKDSAVEELAVAIKTLREGRPFLSRLVSDALLADYVRGAAPDTAALPDDAQVPLTPRQREVLQLVAEGRSTREIAERLHLSVKTVETHRAEVMRRLDIFDLPGLTRYAIRAGLVRL